MCGTLGSGIPDSTGASSDSINTELVNEKNSGTSPVHSPIPSPPKESDETMKASE